MKFLTSIMFLLASINAFSKPVILNSHFQNASLGPYVEYLSDPTTRITINDILDSNVQHAHRRTVQWMKSYKHSLGFGFSPSAYWVRFSIKNDSDAGIECYLNQNYPLISLVDFYIVTDGAVLKEIKTGHNFKFSQRPMNYRTFVFPIQLKPRQEITCYLRYQSDSALIIDLDLYAPNIFQFKEDRESAFLWMFYGILIVMILYHLILFFSVKDIGYLYYMMTIAAMIFLAMGLNGISYQHLWPEYAWWEKYNIPALIGVTYASFLQFGRYFTELRKHMPRTDLTLRALIIISLIAGLSTLVIQNYRFSIIATTTLTFLGIFYNIYILLVLTFVKKSRPARSFLAAVTVLMLGVILYIMKTYGLIPENTVTNYSLQAGWVAMVILLSLGLADRINAMRLQIQEAQKKYIRLLESSNDIIFNLDEHLRFLTVNRAIKKHLGFDPEDVLNTGFLDYIYQKMPKDDDMYRKIFEEYLSGLGKEKETISFRTDFKSKYGKEPVGLSVKLDYIETDGRASIFGTASLVTDDIILNLMDAERQVYFADNNFSHAELLSQRLIKNLGKYLDQSGIQSIKIALMEVIINAIEHGNLGIRFNEKTEAVAGHIYLQFVRERQKDPLYSSKKVKIEYSLSAALVAYRITDEGKGFDHRSILAMSPDSINRELLTHGRGLIIARKAFNVMTFNDTGNQILLVKYFHGPPGEEPRF